MSYLFNSLDSSSSSLSATSSSRAELVVTTRGALGSLLMRRTGRKANSHKRAADYPDSSPCKKQKSEADRNFDSISENLLAKAPIAVHEYVLTRHCTEPQEDEIFEIMR